VQASRDVTDGIVIRLRMARVDEMDQPSASLGGSARGVVMELIANGETRAQWTMSARTLGLSPRSLDAPSSDDAPSLPNRVIGDLEAMLCEDCDTPSLIWLQIVAPSGYLSLLNWERLLRPAVRGAIVRRPYHRLDPVSTHTAMDVLMTCSTSKQSPSVPPPAVIAWTRQIIESMPGDSRCVVHIFADSTYHAELAKLLGGAAGTPAGTQIPDSQRGVILYPHLSAPDTVNPLDDAQRSLNARDHPWTTWILHWLQGTAIDVCHMVGDDALVDGAGYLAIAAYPFIDKPPVRYLDANDICGLMVRVGAWANVMASASRLVRDSRRLVIDTLARLKPGAYAIHLTDTDHDCGALLALYRVLAADTPIVLPPSDNVSLYLPPDRLVLRDYGSPVPSSASNVTAALDSARAATRSAMDAQPATPNWIVAAQRYLETNASGSLDPSPTASSMDTAVHDGVAKAVTFALSSFAESTKRYVDARKRSDVGPSTSSTGRSE